MKQQKILSLWIRNGLPGQLQWDQVVKICDWLCETYNFSFRKAGKGSHWVLAHDLLKTYYEQLNCNYNGEYTICMKDKKCKKIYLKHIVEAYEFIKEVKDEK